MLRHLARGPINLMAHLGVPNQSFNSSWKSSLTLKIEKGLLRLAEPILWNAHFQFTQQLT